MKKLYSLESADYLFWVGKDNLDIINSYEFESSDYLSHAINSLEKIECIDYLNMCNSHIHNIDVRLIGDQSDVSEQMILLDECVQTFIKKAKQFLEEIEEADG